MDVVVDDEKHHIVIIMTSRIVIIQNRESHGTGKYSCKSERQNERKMLKINDVMNMKSS
jgi:stalled ribosome rescue protein Dom34